MTEARDVLKTVYSVADFLDWQRSSTLDLRPYFQRKSVWSKKAKSYYIDTLLRGYPVPLLLLQSTTDTRTFRKLRRVVDGQQRLRTVLSFVDPQCIPDFEDRDDFAIQRSHSRAFAGMRFADLPAQQQRRLLDTEFSVHVLGNSFSREQILEVFARMNSTSQQLNAQELRNAKFHGEFKQLAYELSYEHLEDWRAWGTFTIDQISRMREVELMSELMSYCLTGLASKSSTNLERTYEKHDETFEHADDISIRIRKVLKVLGVLFDAIDEPKVIRRFGSQGWIYPLFAIVHDSKFDAPLNGEPISASVDIEQLPMILTERFERMVSSDVPDLLLKATRGAATDTGSRLARAKFIADPDSLN